MANTTDPKKNQDTTTGTGLDRNSVINSMYDAQREAGVAGLKSAYDTSRSAQEAAKADIAPKYQTAANDTATQYERNRRNFQTQAAGSGLNSGASGQAAVSQNNAYLRAFGNLRAGEAKALADADRGLANLETQYQSDVAKFNAENEAARQTALLNEDNNALTRDRENANLLAQYGDFSGYAALFGQEAADQMAAIWAAQNPDLAYNTGRIDAERYKEMTGKYPVGYNASGDGNNPASNYANLITGMSGPSPGEFYRYAGIYADPSTMF